MWKAQVRETHSKHRHLSLLSFIAAVLTASAAYASRNVGGIFFASFFFLISSLRFARLTNFIVLVSSITLSLSIAEITIGLLAPPHPQGNTTYFSPDSDYMKKFHAYRTMSPLGFLPLPGNYTSKKLSRNGDILYDVTYSIGDDGFRITPQSNNSVQIHINFLGCSFTFGEGLNDDATLPFSLQASDEHISVKNYGMHGYGVHQALRIAETMSLTGDINFLLTAPWHSERSACIPIFGQGSPRYILKNGQATLDGKCPIPDGDSVRTRILDHSHLYRQIKQLLRERSQDGEIDLYLALVEKLHIASLDHGQRFIVGFIKADDGWFSGTYTNQKIMDHLASMGIELLDLTLAPSDDQLGKEYFIHELDRHPSAQANMARATLLRQYLKDHPIPGNQTLRSH